MCNGCSEYKEHPQKIKFHINAYSWLLIIVHGIPCTKCKNEFVYMRNTQCWMRISLPLSLIGGGSSHVWMTEMSFVCNTWNENAVVWAGQLKTNIGTDNAWLCTYFSSNWTTVFSSLQQFFFFSFWQQAGRFDNSSSSWQWDCWLTKNDVNTPSSSQACVNTGIPMFPKNSNRLKNKRVSVFTIQR